MARDYTLKGNKVQIRYTIKGHGNDLLAGWIGTVQYMQDNGLGQNLLYVVWDESGSCIPVFPEDIEAYI